MTTTRIAVRATIGEINLSADYTEEWTIVEIPTEYLGNHEGEGEEVATALPTKFDGFIGDVIVVDSIDGYTAGCSTWSRFSRDDDDEFDQGSEYAQARAEHWNCEHERFGSQH